MTVDSELRKIWRKDLEALRLELAALAQRITRIDAELQTHHPRIQLPTPPIYPRDPTATVDLTNEVAPP